jgi:hypothetical protein
VTVLVDVNDEALGGNFEMGAMYVLLVTKQHFGVASALQRQGYEF